MLLGSTSPWRAETPIRCRLTSALNSHPTSGASSGLRRPWPRRSVAGRLGVVVRTGRLRSKRGYGGPRPLDYSREGCGEAWQAATPEPIEGAHGMESSRRRLDSASSPNRYQPRRLRIADRMRGISLRRDDLPFAFFRARDRCGILLDRGSKTTTSTLALGGERSQARQSEAEEPMLGWGTSLRESQLCSKPRSTGTDSVDGTHPTTVPSRARSKQRNGSISASPPDPHGEVPREVRTIVRTPHASLVHRGPSNVGIQAASRPAGSYGIRLSG